METIAEAVAAGELTSKWHGGKIEQQFDGDGLRDSRTITFGAATSNSRLRIYDKQAEQRDKGNDPGEAPWVRVELQLRDEQAEALIRQIVESAGAAEALLGVIRGHLEFKERSVTDSNKRRWMPVAWWAAFLQHATKRRLGIGRPLRTLETVLRWTDRQVAPALALIVRAHGGSWRYLRRLVEGGDRRLKPRDLALLAPAAVA
jgi:DNA relaxase NicK